MPLTINPPLLNSANPWCSNLEQLQELYNCLYTGAVTTRTALLDNGFPHDDSTHQFTFFNPLTQRSHSGANPTTNAKSIDMNETASLNTLGYSPLPLKDYLSFIKTISDGLSEGSKLKPFIISVTGTAEQVVECYRRIVAHQKEVKMVLAMEVNLSCPNIPDKPPPAYDSEALKSYLAALKLETAKQSAPNLSPEHQGNGNEHVPVGIKTPPYTYADQFKQLITTLVYSATDMEPKNLGCPISFLTTTNTLGTSLLLTPTTESNTPVYHHTLNSSNGTGIGGMAGAPLHPLALGNVYTLKGLLFQYPEMENVQIIGVGGVEDAEGFKRMRAVGAAAVGVGTALGRRGMGVFGEIGRGVGVGE
ncbi:FMN-linked oxidoreductase [Delitschia confertaspora ATCC 74209]|uniref:Dihydroorotate dehydrogenase (fumarate) n=1 Tax=Delitschia confertaspora ATCC 74209 TaxID=1513339 RepID=A0A9P4JC43_9PLEO|nr:FMN-linked oxidoreductase [Delitschia confertaspora ATCC 74209]